MAQTDTAKLDVGDTFPAMALTLADGNTFALPDDLTRTFTILVGYRGKW